MLTRRHPLLITLLLLTLLVGPAGTAMAAPEGEAPPKAPAGGAKAAAPAPLMSGEVLVVRGLGGPQAQVTDAAGKRWLVIGALSQELARLSGHRLDIWGNKAVKKGSDDPLVEVTRYRLRGDERGAALVGVLEVDGSGRLLLRAGEGARHPLHCGRGLIRRLHRKVGCKVWARGKVHRDGTMDAFKAGWLACPAPAADKPAGDKPAATENKKGREAR